MRVRFRRLSEHLCGSSRKTRRTIRSGGAFEVRKRVEPARGDHHEVASSLGGAAGCLEKILDEERIGLVRIQRGLGTCQAFASLADGRCPHGRAQCAGKRPRRIEGSLGCGASCPRFGRAGAVFERPERGPVACLLSQSVLARAHRRFRAWRRQPCGHREGKRAAGASRRSAFFRPSPRATPDVIVGKKERSADHRIARNAFVRAQQGCRAVGHTGVAGDRGDGKGCPCGELVRRFLELAFERCDESRTITTARGIVCVDHVRRCACRLVGHRFEQLPDLASFFGVCVDQASPGAEVGAQARVVLRLTGCTLVRLELASFCVEACAPRGAHGPRFRRLIRRSHERVDRSLRVTGQRRSFGESPTRCRVFSLVEERAPERGRDRRGGVFRRRA